MYETYKRFGRKIKSYRKMRGYSSQELAKELNVSVGLINNLENAKNDVFKIDLLLNLINILQMPKFEIFEFNKMYEEINYDSTNNLLQIKLSTNAIEHSKVIESLIKEITFDLLEFIVRFDDKQNVSSLLLEYFKQQLKVFNNIIDCK